MINPVHKVKRYAVYADGRPTHWTETGVAGWLSTGIKDRNGREIFEGDKVLVTVSENETLESVVRFYDSAFVVLENFLLTNIESDDIEVIGHVMEGIS